VSLLVLAGCADADIGIEALSLPMGYVANVQFSPFYVAKERGYFREAGFDVSFDYRWETDGIQLVAAGEIPFAVASGDQVIQARAMGLPVVAVAAWYQSFPVGIVSLKQTSLDEPVDLAGLTIGIPETFGASYIGLRALLETGGLQEQDIELQAIGYTQLAALTSESVDAVVVYANNEPVVLAQEGIEYNALFAADYVDLISAVIVSSDMTVREEPEKVTRFVAAFLRGVEAALEDPEEAFSICEGYVEGLSDNRDLQWPVLLASVDLWRAPQLGMMEAASWERSQDVMVSAGLIDQTSPADELFTNEFALAWTSTD
jgi:NitT/TauT family transport system substrate-binding protein